MLPAAFNLHREVAEVRHDQRLQQQAAVGVRIHAHAPAALGRDVGELVAECAFLVEEFFRLVAAHPLFELAQVIRLFAQSRSSGTWCARQVFFHRLAVDKLSVRSSPWACA